MSGATDSASGYGRAARRLLIVPGLSGVVCAAIIGFGCENRPAESAPGVPEVDVAKPVVRRTVEWDEYTGRLAAVETVEVRARVDGYLEKIHFKAGQIVSKGDLLFTIDPRPFVAELDRASAEVSRAQAELDHAEFDLHRVEQLWKDKIAPEKEYRDAVWVERRAHSELDRAQSERRLAALHVEWTGVVAPISGRISRETVTIGNLIHNGGVEATVLTTIVSLDPIHCYFDADEQAYLKYSRMSRSGERRSSREYASPVQIALFDEADFVHHGVMDFVDNALDQQTGTMRGRAVIPNPDGLLVPGLFVRVRLIGSGYRSMVFVPDAAIAADLMQRLVYVVDDQQVAHQRVVKPGRLQNGLRRILEGLDGTETIVVSGVQRVRADSKVSAHLVDVCAAAWVPDSLCTTQPTSMPASGPATMRTVGATGGGAP